MMGQGASCGTIKSKLSGKIARNLVRMVVGDWREELHYGEVCGRGMWGEPSLVTHG